MTEDETGNDTFNHRVDEAGDIDEYESSLDSMLRTQMQVQMLTLQYSTASNMEHAKHMNMKAMAEKIGQS